MKAIGIDLTNAVSQCSSCADTDWFPAVILPMVQDEPILVGKDAKLHRRGAGLLWPPESQIPYSNNPKYGKGRVTLAEAWRYLASFETQDSAWDNYQPFQRQISWQPNPADNRSKVSFSAEDIISEAAGACIDNFSDHDLICFVVPDDIGEGAQQALLDRLGATSAVHLLPRPIAIATDWCSRQNPDKFRIIDRDSGCCGYIWVLSAGLDRWEFCPMDIRKVSFGQTEFLIPVRDHTEHSSGLAVDGLSMLAAYAIGVNKADISDVWFKIVSSNLIEELLNDTSLNCYTDDFHRACSAVKEWSGRLAKTNQDCSINPDSLNSELIKHANKFKKRDRDCIGTIADGSLAGLCMGGVSIAGRVLDQYEDYGIFEVTNGSATLNGAKLVAQQLERGLPTYRDRIAPIEIFYKGNDEFWDPVISTKTLIEGTTVEAGKVARTKEPIKEFFIPAGQDSLTLILRRKFGNKQIIRQVSAGLRESVADNENVVITAEVRPGQGFATALIRSQRPGFFETKLNWKTMKDGTPPPAPKYAWPPGVANVHSNVSRWDLAPFEEISKVLSDFRPRRNTPHAVSEFRKYIAFWLNGNEPYQYDGRIASSDSFNRFARPEVLEELSRNLGDAIDLAPSNDQLIRLAGWMYEACPASAIKVAVERIKKRQEMPCDLEVAGKAFVKKEHIQVFVEMFVERIRELKKNYSIDSNNNWIRAFRDLIRFRVDPLRPEFIKDSQINTIEKYIIGLMYYESNRRGPKYNNCLYIAPHILKRRRFDDEFLAVDSKRWKEWNEMFEYASKVGMNRQKDMAKAMLKLLKEEATLGDIKILASNEK
ncbi:hypothetical protein [Pontiella agarivorans]|uniref:Uncharacterized protein n=1 Tax=Pontiella agarivorans TaxID=3038953 RepID=A0ABU5N0L1_9BACT|nr:hypothetical protein [Pontiella agarivorans]MDZ8119987.1 hypothetical protein [Pontiella agarivorans]